MEYLFSTITVQDGTENRLMRIKDQQELKEFTPGFYYSHTETYPDMTITDNFKIQEQIKTSEDSEGNHYAWYLISDYSRNIDGSPGVAANVEKEKTINAINFVTLAEQGHIDDVTAGEHTDMFAEWAYPIAYTQGQIRRYQDKLYKCISAHNSQEDWTPDKTANLWKQISDPNEEWPEWSRPIGAFDAYQTGDKVIYEGKHYTSLIDNNVWSPTEYAAGWDEVN